MKQLYTFLCAAVLLGAASRPAQAQWAGTLIGNSYVSENAAVLDASGNTYLAGECDRTLNINNAVVVAPYLSTGNNQFFVARFSPQGTVSWAQRGGGSSTSYGRAVAVGANGIVTVAGEFNGTMLVGGASGVTLTTTTEATTEGFVVCYDAQGTVLAAWVVRGAAGKYECNDMVVDASGNSYVTGQRTTTTLTGTVRTRFLRKYTNQGQLVWSNDITGSDLDNIRLGLLGTTVLATGYFDTKVTFSSQSSLTNGGMYAAFYNGQTGTVNSAVLLANAGFPAALQVDATGAGFYLGGAFRRSMG